jgi:hypothetical protein
MKTEKYLNEEELIKKAVGALIQELGPVETARFVNLPLPKKRMESVKRHRRWQKSLDKEKFIKELFG